MRADTHGRSPSGNPPDQFRHDAARLALQAPTGAELAVQDRAAVSPARGFNALGAGRNRLSSRRHSPKFLSITEQLRHNVAD